MAFYYTMSTATLALNTSGSTQTEVDHLSIKPGASRAIQIVQMRISARHATVGGGSLRLKRWTSTATAIGSGASQTIAKKDAGAQASVSTAVNNSSGALTAGTGGPDILDSIGFSQTGAQGFWGASEPNDAYVIEASATKSFDLFSIANGTTVPIDITTEHIE